MLKRKYIENNFVSVQLLDACTQRLNPVRKTALADSMCIKFTCFHSMLDDLKNFWHSLQEAIHRYGKPEIFNTAQGSQFTSEDFSAALKDHDIKISMDGKVRWVDNVFVERLWRSVKYENVYLRAYESITALREGIKDYFLFYNTKRTHQSLAKQTPDEVYFEHNGLKEAA